MPTSSAWTGDWQRTKVSGWSQEMSSMAPRSRMPHENASNCRGMFVSWGAMYQSVAVWPWHSTR